MTVCLYQLVFDLYKNDHPIPFDPSIWRIPYLNECPSGSRSGSHSNVHVRQPEGVIIPEYMTLYGETIK